MASDFTRLLDGTGPGRLLWRDDLVGVALAPTPIRDGHVVVFTVEEVDAWYDVPAPTSVRLIEVAQAAARVAGGLFPCRKVGLAALGLATRHAHLHLVPLDAPTDLDFSRQDPSPDPARMDAVAARLRGPLADALGPGR